MKRVAKDFADADRPPTRAAERPATTTPWTQEGNRVLANANEHGQKFIVAELVDTQRGEADAKLIVTAVNNHATLLRQKRELREALRQIEAQHKQMRGEARSDPDRYCAICTAKDGGASRFPCKTVRLVRAALNAAAGEGEGQVER